MVLIEEDGFVDCTKNEFAELMYERTRRPQWLKKDGSPNRSLVEDVCNLTRDQDAWPEVATELSGYRVVYAPSKGGMVLIGADGEMKLEHLVRMLWGDARRQQEAKTVGRRRVSSWRTAAQMASRSGDLDLGLLMAQMENEVNTTGFVSDSLYTEFEAALRKRGITV